MKYCVTLLWCFIALNVSAQETHRINLGKDISFIENGHFKQGSNRNPNQETIGLNNFFLKKNGHPYFPVMGEFHYSRYPKNEWEEAILKMKAAGVKVIAFYNFWIHHEQEQNKFRFDDNLDVRFFIELCAKHKLLAVARLGPWAHGECRNGGYPDWFLSKMKNGFDRVTSKGSVEPEVEQWYAQLAKQFKGLYYKDGGPLIGVQLDNEVRSNGPGSQGFEYMASLKKLAVKVGMDVPLYVVTGWPGPQVPEDEVLPLFGGYPDAPWTQHVKDLPANNLYNFVTDRRDKNIGNDILNYQKEEGKADIYRHPYLTVEMGGGMQVTYHRRPTLKAADLMGLIYTRLGVGANMMGYYVFHGTQHPLSWKNEYPTQESKSTKFPYPNDYPMISYDFQAPITEWGLIRDYYHDFKLIHQFIDSYGKKLAPMFPIVPTDNPTTANDLEKLRYSVRSSKGAGFLFINNYLRHFNLANHQQVSFVINTGKEELKIPQNGTINIGNGVYAVFPFNDDLNGVKLKYATAQPSTILNNKIQTFCYFAVKGVTPEFCFDNSNIKSITALKAKIEKKGKLTFIKQLVPGKEGFVTITTLQGKTFQLLLLNEEEARYSYKFNIKGNETLLLTNKQVFYNETTNALTMRSIDENSFNIHAYPAINSTSFNLTKLQKTTPFTSYLVQTPKWIPVDVNFKQISNDQLFNNYTDSLKGATPTSPTYGINFDAKLPFKNYQIDMPKALPANVKDVLVEFNYQGNTAALYANNLIVADNYYTGDVMPFTLRRNQTLLKEQRFTLQITPLMPVSAIHFERGTPLDFTKKQPAQLNSIAVKPIYEIIF